ncbi:SCO family protein [Microbulbifer sp. SA54]|uniref:SCO family protein n=1 Tax=Microbulbifer sp. SA54 TaxID=3401577 RepID=UPI003AACB6DA
MSESNYSAGGAAVAATNSAMESGHAGRKAGVGRIAALGVLAAVALPIVAAYLVYQTGFGIPKDTVNQGELLLPPQSVAELGLLDDSGETLDLTAESPLWHYLIVSEQGCSDVCAELLYTTRQVHIGLGDKAHRVERILVTDTALGGPAREEIAKQHPRMRFAVANSQQLKQWLADSDHADQQTPSVLLVDQEGFAMMVYDHTHSGKQLRQDIKRLLKYSYEP